MGYFINVSLTAIDLPAADIDINMAASTMEKRCSKCHNLDRIVGARKDAPGWLATVNRMKALPDSAISEEDARIIVSYLASQILPAMAPVSAQIASIKQRFIQVNGIKMHIAEEGDGPSSPG